MNWAVLSKAATGTRCFLQGGVCVSVCCTVSPFCPYQEAARLGSLQPSAVLPCSTSPETRALDFQGQETPRAFNFPLHLEEHERLTSQSSRHRGGAPAIYLCEQNVDDFLVLVHFLLGDVLLRQAGDFLCDLCFTLLPQRGNTQFLIPHHCYLVPLPGHDGATPDLDVWPVNREVPHLSLGFS